MLCNAFVKNARKSFISPFLSLPFNALCLFNAFMLFQCHSDASLACWALFCLCPSSSICFCLPSFVFLCCLCSSFYFFYFVCHYSSVASMHTHTCIYRFRPRCHTRLPIRIPNRVQRLRNGKNFIFQYTRHKTDG